MHTCLIPHLHLTPSFKGTVSNIFFTAWLTLCTVCRPKQCVGSHASLYLCSLPPNHRLASSATTICIVRTQNQLIEHVQYSMSNNVISLDVIGDRFVPLSAMLPLAVTFYRKGESRVAIHINIQERVRVTSCYTPDAIISIHTFTSIHSNFNNSFYLKLLNFA